MSPTPQPLRREIFDLQLDRSVRPMHRQIYLALRAAILSRSLPQGSYVPATRVLMQQLECSRTTVLKAYDQLIAEGYLETFHGAGTRVAALPMATAPRLERHGASPRAAPPTRATFRLSKRGMGFAATGRNLLELRAPAFTLGMTELGAFPFDAWARLQNRVWRRPDLTMAQEHDAAGYLPLRQSIARYLTVLRGVRCTPEQVLVTSGASHAFDLLSRVLLDRGDRAWIEDPGYQGLRILRASGASIVPVPVDESGLQVREGERLAPDARLVAVTPSHQFPLGCVLSLQRRLELLDWARRAKAWILEDDFNCEFRYSGAPLSPMQSLDEDGRVVYIGTFSKIMFPALRLGYIVANQELIEQIAHARRLLDLQTSIALQPVLAEFMDEGHFMSHIRKVRRLYARRQQAMLEAARQHLGGLLEVSPQPAGMHLLGLFDPRLAARASDKEVSSALAKRSITVRPLSDCYLSPARRRQGLLLGYAAVDESVMASKIAELAAVLRGFTERGRERASGARARTGGRRPRSG
jgi:GntR family transcriptional regulator/MocR family aminotransferase